MAKKITIPKRVGALKVPRAVRKSKLLRGLLNHPLGREIVGNALIAGAGAAAGALVRERENVAGAAGAGMRKGRRAGFAVAEAARDASDAMMGVFSDSLQSLAPKQKKRQDREDDRSRRDRRRGDRGKDDLGLQH